MTQYENYILLGPPGSGKSTVAKILCGEIGIRHIEMGNELRKAASEDTELGRMIYQIIFEKKELVPDGIVEKVVDEILSEYDGGILLDGAPRCVPQIDDIMEVLEHHERPLKKVIYLALPLEVGIDRIVKRMICRECGTPYKIGKHVEAETKVCSVCGGEVIHRADDSEAGVRKRYEVFEEKTMPVIEHFRATGQLLEINGEGTPEDVEKEVVRGLGL
jgi:adenylate kinase